MSHNEIDPSQVEQTTQAADPEVVVVAERRKFSSAYKLRIPEEADQCTESGQECLASFGLLTCFCQLYTKFRLSANQFRLQNSLVHLTRQK